MNDNMALANSAVSDTEQPAQPQQPKSFAKSFFSDLFDGQDMFRVTPQHSSYYHTTYAGYSFYLPEVALNIPHQPPQAS